MSRFELRRQARMAMRGVPERLGLSFAGGSVEMRAKPNGTAAGSRFEWRGYAAVYDHDFPMWDPNGEPYTEYVAQGACARSLNNPNLDVPFLIGHNDAGIPLARTKAGTMHLSEDTHGLHVHVPSMDGSREEVRALASAVERGDLDEMSLAFVCLRQAWDEQFERRGVLEMDIHRGDVCAVTHGANSGTAGAWMTPVEQLSFRRPAAIGGPVLLGERRMPTQPYSRGADEMVTCPQCKSGNDASARFCDQCGTGLRPTMPYVPDSDDVQECRNGHWNDADAKICAQCGVSLVNDHDADDGYMGYASRRPVETRAQMSTKSINDLPDSDFAYIEPGGHKDSGGRTVPRSLRHFPIHDAAHVRNALARLPQSSLSDEAKASARRKIMAAAHKFGIDVSSEHAAGLPLEHLASAADDINLASRPDYDAAAAAHPEQATHAHAHVHADGTVHSHEHGHPMTVDHGHGHSATVRVDDSTGIPGPEVQMSAALARERRAMLLELEELALHG